MRVAVLGGGLQGACVALELARSGIPVDLYEKSDRCVSQASAQNEGKIHLGYVYAKDRTLDTARLMIRGALSFSPLIRRWIGSEIERVPVSRPFYYAVHKDSLLSADEVEGHLRACNAIAREMGNGDAIDYLGADYRRSPVRMKSHGDLFDDASIVAAFVTPEVAVDAAVLAGFVRERLTAEPQINCIVNANVIDVSIAGSRVEVQFEIAGERRREGYDHVVNALWDGRLAIDATLGIHPVRPWLFRTKFYVRSDPAAPIRALPSTTIVLGAFGDVVGYPGGGFYLSWYPAGMRHVSRELRPSGWPLDLDQDMSSRMRETIVSSLAGIVPAVASLDRARLESCRIQGGVIFAWGATDITDPSSELHARSDVGARSYGRYHSIDTGKLTLAPLFAKAMADRIRGS